MAGPAKPAATSLTFSSAPQAPLSKGSPFPPTAGISISECLDRTVGAIKSNLTLTTDLRYDVNSSGTKSITRSRPSFPANNLSCFQAPRTDGYSPVTRAFPTLAPTRWNNFAPRLGLAYSFGDHDGALGKILGKPGTTSIRVG